MPENYQRKPNTERVEPVPAHRPAGFGYLAKRDTIRRRLTPAEKAKRQAAKGRSPSR